LALPKEIIHSPKEALEKSFKIATRPAKMFSCTIQSDHYDLMHFRRACSKCDGFKKTWKLFANKFSKNARELCLILEPKLFKLTEGYSTKQQINGKGIAK